MKTTVGIVNWNSGRLLEECVESALRVPHVDVLVVDNASSDGSNGFLATLSNKVKHIASPQNRGFAGGVNQIFNACDSPYVLILNPDVWIPPGSVQLMEEFMDTHPRAAAVGGYVGEKYPPRKLPTPWGLVMENLGMSGARDELNGHTGFIPVEQVAAAALMIRREACKKAPVFDETFYPAWYEDVDFCRRLKRDNWEVYFAPDLKFPHSGGYSAKTMGGGRFVYAYYRNQLRYAKKWFDWYEVVVVRASIVVGAVGRIIARPAYMLGYSKVLFGALIAW